MDPETLKTVVFVTFLIVLALLIAFFILVNDVRAIKNKFRAGSDAKRSQLEKALEKARFVENRNDVVSLNKELAYVEIYFPFISSTRSQLKRLKGIADEIKNNGGVVPSGLADKIESLKTSE